MLSGVEQERLQRQFREARRALDRALEPMQRFAAQYADKVATFVESLGGAEAIQSVMRGAAAALAVVVEALPPNWPPGLDYERAIDLANEGIPVVWVPPGEVLTELVEVENRAARMAVLRSHADELANAIDETFDTVTHPDLAGQVPLARLALKAWREGHIEAAQALAVAVTEAIVTRHYSKGRGYKEVRDAAKFHLDGDIAVSELRLAVAVAPIWSFYTSWWPSSGDPAPEALSRHVTVHQADISHYTPDNALIAILLQTAVLRAFHGAIVNSCGSGVSCSDVG
jgi:hypothetical protein